MMYPYMTFSDDTEVTHSQMHEDGTVKVFIETPVEGGFKDLICVLPTYEWKNEGYTESELKYWEEYVRNNAHVIMELAQEGGFAHATAV